MSEKGTDDYACGITSDLDMAQPCNLTEVRDSDRHQLQHPGHRRQSNTPLAFQQAEAAEYDLVHYQEIRPIQLLNSPFSLPTKNETTPTNAHDNLGVFQKPNVSLKTPTRSGPVRQNSTGLASMPSDAPVRPPSIKSERDDSTPTRSGRKRDQADWGSFVFSGEDRDFVVFLTLNGIPADVVAKQWRLYRRGDDKMIPKDQSSDGEIIQNQIKWKTRKGGTEKSSKEYIQQLMIQADKYGWYECLRRARQYIATCSEVDGGKSSRRQASREIRNFQKYTLDRKSLPTGYEEDKFGRLASAGLQRQRDEYVQSFQLALSEGYVVGDKEGELRMLMGKLQDLWDTGAVKSALTF